MIRLFQSNWVAALLGGLLYLGVTVLAFPSASQLKASLPEKTESGFTSHNEPSWNFRNPELDQMILELQQEKELLTTREQHIKDLEARLKAESAELAGVTQTVARMQREFDQNVTRLKEQETTNLKRLAKTHAAMSPAGSANILKELPDDDVLKILAYLKADEAGPILEAVGRLGKDEAKRAAQLTDRLRRTISPTSGGK
ncbi:MAG: hypothetical protein HZA90_17070 [Verrucomicrobia bacterium]|nr:hypothetical protein [Verrucomicrobiota bacterium]